jgi:hypothetical protein
MKRALAAALFASAALSGCGSVTAGMDFKAPAGWTATPSILGRIQVWTKKSADNKDVDMVILARGSSTIDLKNIPQAGVGTITTEKQATIAICGDRKAQFMSGTASGHSGQKQTMEMVSAMVGQDDYVSMYIRPQSERADPAAETAIRSLCPAKT